MKRHLLALAACGAVLGAAFVARAEVRFTDPPNRQGRTDQRKAPCGQAPRSANYTKYAAGANVTVKWDEINANQGCFQVALLDNNDNTVVSVFKQLDDPAGTQTGQSTTIALPGGKTCQACTLQIRQFTVGGCNDAGLETLDGGNAFFACSDICIGDTCPALPVADAGSDAGPVVLDDAGVPVTPRGDGGDGEGTSGFKDAGTNEGCAVAGAGAGGLAGLGFVAIALLRRRRKP
jgi:MYXO-CTERM domain-containing protein